jgi:chemotaxis signal transduction protein
MSDSKKIADHDNALNLYFDEMLVESNADIVTGKTQARLARTQASTHKDKPATKYDQNKSFQAVLFDINGLQLAIRSEDIKAILPWPETLLNQRQETPNNAVIMGLYDDFPNQKQIINTAHIVLPTQHRQNLAIPSFIIVVNEYGLALSCHKINSVVTLSAEEINWRRNSKTRLWLAGTSIKTSCGIVNLQGLVNLLNSTRLA